MQDICATGQMCSGLTAFSVASSRIRSVGFFSCFADVALSLPVPVAYTVIVTILLKVIKEDKTRLLAPVCGGLPSAACTPRDRGQRDPLVQSRHWKAPPEGCSELLFTPVN